MDIPKIFKDKDADLNFLQGKRVGIIGFGNQGRTQALNLRDSGVEVVVGLRDSSPSAGSEASSKQNAMAEGLSCTSIKEVVQTADIISILIPDQVMGRVYAEKIAPNLKPRQTILFSHGYNIHYGLIKPPENVNIIMAAPSGPGTELRRQYENGGGIPGLIAVQQDYTGDAKDLVLAYSKAIGLTRIGVFESTFQEETETDIFGEQAVLTGGIPKLIQSAYNVLLEAGYSPLTAWFVCYYELKTIVDLFHSKGFEFMNKAISDTAEYGGITRGNQIIDEHVRDKMRKALIEIKSGDFHREWMEETEKGFPMLNQLRKSEKQLPIEKVGKHILKELFDKEN